MHQRVTSRHDQWRAGDRSWASLIQRVLWLLAALVFTVNDIGMLPGLATAIRFDARYVLVGLLFAAAQAAGVVNAFRSRGRPLGIGILTAGSLGGLYLAAGLGQPHAAGDLWWPGIQLFVAAATASAAFASPAASQVVSVALVAAGAPALLVRQPDLQWDTAEPVVVTLLQALMVGYIVGRSLRQFPAFGRAADDASEQRRRLAAERVADLARPERLRDVRRFVHDEVLHTLRVVAMAGGTVTHTEARLYAQQTLAKLDQPLPPAPQHGFVDLRDQLTALPTRLRISWQSRPTLVPASVADAVSSATAEALRNIERHAGTSQAHITVVSSGEQVRVSVVDHGVGFDVNASHGAGRHGLADSVLARMRDIDGDATLASAPGLGTRVDLTWGVPLPRAAGRSWGWADDSVGDMLRWMLHTFAPVPLAGAIICLVQVASVERPVIGVAAGIALVAIYLVFTRRGLTAGITRLESTCLTVSAPAVALAGAAATRTGDTVTAHQTLCGSACALVVLVVAFRPAWEALVAAAALSATVILIVAVHMGILGDLAQSVPIILSPLVGIAAAFAIQVALRTIGQELARADDARLRATAAAAHAATFQAAIARHLDLVGTGVHPLLATVAASSTVGQTSRTEAARLEQQLRDDLGLGHAPATRAALARLREHGISTSARMPQDPPTRVDAAAAELLSSVQLDDGEHPARRVTLTVLPDGPGHRVSLLIRPAHADVRVPANPAVRRVTSSGGIQLTIRIEEPDDHT